MKALRSAYIFPEFTPAFPLLTDIISSLHLRVQSSLNPASLARAVSLSNLATFVWTVLQPDKAGDLLEDGDDVPEVGKGKRRLIGEKRVVRRNRMLLLAWKRFWLVVVPKEKRSNEMVLQLWLDFATQVARATDSLIPCLN